MFDFVKTYLKQEESSGKEISILETKNAFV